MDPNANGETIVGLITRLIDDVERFVRAEISLYRAQLIERTRQAKGAIIMLLIAAVLSQAAIFALIVVLIRIAERWLGIYWASAVVIGGTLVVVAVLVQLGLGRLRVLTRISDEDE